jgi:FdhE protein
VKPPAAELQDALEDLNRLAVARPSWSQPIEMMREILPVVARDTAATALPISLDAARAKLLERTPALRGETVAVDAADIERRWSSICKILHRYRNDAAARSLAGIWRRQARDVNNILRDVLQSTPHELRDRAAADGLDGLLFCNVLRWTVYPVLSALRYQLAAALAGSSWSDGHCPVCGNWPLLAEFRGLEQTRYLRCGHCAAEWSLARLHCPFCGNRDHRRLGFLYADGEQSRYRAATCDDCGGYVKTVSSLQPLAGLQLFAADVATLHLDLAAAHGSL